MRQAIAGFCIILGLAATASAGPITGGYWELTQTPDLELHKSEDCATCASIWYLEPGTETLQGGWGFTDWPGGTPFIQLTDYPEGELHYDGMAFHYDNKHGFATNSWAGSHILLSRKVTADATRYWLRVEDLERPVIYDWNDFGVTWDDSPGDVSFPAIPPGEPETPVPAPEPGTIGLVTFGLFHLWRRRNARAHSNSTG